MLWIKLYLLKIKNIQLDFLHLTSLLNLLRFLLFNVVYFDQRMHACACICMVKNNEKHQKSWKSTFFIMHMIGSWRKKRKKWLPKAGWHFFHDYQMFFTVFDHANATLLERVNIKKWKSTFFNMRTTGSWRKKRKKVCWLAIGSDSQKLVDNFFMIFNCFLQFLNMQIHVQACICWSKYTTIRSFW